MISKIDKNTVRQKRHARVRKTITGTAETPRMNVYRSLNHIYVQVIDDRAGDAKGGVTLAAASTMEKAVKEKVAGLSKTDAAKVDGERHRIGSIRQRRVSLHGTRKGSRRRRKRSRT